MRGAGLEGAQLDHAHDAHARKREDCQGDAGPAQGSYGTLELLLPTRAALIGPVCWTGACGVQGAGAVGDCLHTGEVQV